MPTITIRPGTVATRNNEAAEDLRLANIDLLAGKDHSAIDKYNHILVSTSPGHPAAYMNRSIAYALLKRYDQAVRDAQHAVQSIDYATSDDGSDEKKYKKAPMSKSIRKRQVYTYLHMCDQARDAEEPWTKSPMCFPWRNIKTGLLRLDIVTRLVGPQKGLQEFEGGEIEGEELDGEGDGGKEDVDEDYFLDLRMKARYRLVLFLWKAGRGVLTAGWVSDLAKGCGARRKENIWDRKEFVKLDNAMLLQVETGAVDWAFDTEVEGMSCVGDGGNGGGSGADSVLADAEEEDEETISGGDEPMDLDYDDEMNE